MIGQKIRMQIKSNSNQITWENISESLKENINIGLLELKNNKGIDINKAMLKLSEKYGLAKKAK